MRFLLDTHAVLWWLGDDERLGPRAREAVADPTSDVLVSVVSLWEVAVKIRIGKLAADVGDIVDAITADGFTLLPIGPKHLVALGALPFHADHRDPFDHLLMAQSIVEDAVFISEDRNTRRYPVRFVTCSDPASRPTSR